MKKLLKLLRNNLVLIAILFLFLSTRLYKIAEIPSSVYWDEASIGYNAFSITHDLRDEWGEYLPLHFRAFGEFKLPVYIYSVAIFVKLFGLNEFTLRLPAVLYGLGSVVALYLLVLKVAKDKLAGLLSSFIFSITPWVFIFTRTGYEATAGLFLFLFGSYLLIWGLERQKFFIFGVIMLITSMYSYTSFRITVPITLFIFLIILFRKNFKRKTLLIITSIFMFMVGLIPIVRLFVYDAGFGRAQSFALIPGFQQVYDLSGKPHFQLTFNREGISWSRNLLQISKNYFSHFSYNFLFKDGDINNRSQIPGWGQIYFVGLPLLVLGLVWLFFNRNKNGWLFLLFLLIGAIPSSITRESPHALRSILLSPTLSAISAFGVIRLIDRFDLKKYRNLFIMGVVSTYLLFFCRYFFDFIKNYNLITSSDWQYEYKEIFTNTKSGMITDKYAQPYIFALYYLKYPPSQFRKTVKYNDPSKWGFSTVKSFGNFEFK